MRIRTIVTSVLFCFCLVSFNTFAGIVLSGTRVIFDGNKKETSVTVTNPDTAPYLIQSWISLDDQKASEFIVTPPLFRLDGHMSNALRIVLTDNALSQTQESLFWLNVKSIPPSDPNAQDSLLIALNTKIKLIYRPSVLINQDANVAYQKLTFKIDSKSQQLIAVNPTGYYINLSSLRYGNQNIDNPGVVAPFSEAQWSVTSAKTPNIKVEWRAINDFGGTSSAQFQDTNVVQN